MNILAHPDAESLGAGGILAKYAAEGVETYLLTATRGEHGWWGSDADYPGPEALGRTRAAELRAAAKALRLREVVLLDYMDGEVDQADTAEVIAKIVAQIRHLKPNVVVTFDPNGVYGHPDHIAISQLATAAVVTAADAAYADSGQPSHRVSKLYYRTFTSGELAAYQAAFGDLVMNIDRQERRGRGWPERVNTTRIDAGEYWPQVWRAICRCSNLVALRLAPCIPRCSYGLWSDLTDNSTTLAIECGPARGCSYGLWSDLTDNHVTFRGALRLTN